MAMPNQTIQWPVHRPDINRPYGFDWTNYLISGEEIDTVEFDVPAGLTNPGGDMGVTTGAQETWVRLTGGTAGEQYEVVGRILTSESNTYELVAVLSVDPA